MRSAKRGAALLLAALLALPARPAYALQTPPQEVYKEAESAQAAGEMEKAVDADSGREKEAETKKEKAEALKGEEEAKKEEGSQEEDSSGEEENGSEEKEDGSEGEDSGLQDEENGSEGAKDGSEGEESGSESKGDDSEGSEDGPEGMDDRSDGQEESKTPEEPDKGESGEKDPEQKAPGENQTEGEGEENKGNGEMTGTETGEEAGEDRNETGEAGPEEEDKKDEDIKEETGSGSGEGVEDGRIPEAGSDGKVSAGGDAEDVKVPAGSGGAAEPADKEEAPAETLNPDAEEKEEEVPADAETSEEETPEEEEAPEEEIPAEEEILEEKPEEDVEEVIFNTGSCEFHVVSREDFDREMGDAFFEEDGSYTIQIPEENPFFPYEVQFTYEGETTEEWFMEPDDHVKVGGHTFYVSAYFDGTVMTQMSLEIAGDTVVVYPEEKEFTNDGGASAASLMPLEERRLNVDLTRYTPVELTMVSVDSIFTGDEQLGSGDHVMWCPDGENKYMICSPGEYLNLSYQTCNGSVTWEMIAGDDDQLAADNIRYKVRAEVTDSEQWLLPLIYAEDNQGVRNPLTIINNKYSDYYGGGWAGGWHGHTNISADDGNIGDDAEIYVGLKINPSVFRQTEYDRLEVYRGLFDSPEDVEESQNITDLLFAEDMEQIGAGCPLRDIRLSRIRYITILTYKSGKVTGCLRVWLRIHTRDYEEWKDRKDIYSYLYKDMGDNGRKEITYTTDWDEIDDTDTQHIADREKEIKILDYGYPAEGTYNLVFTYTSNNDEDFTSEVTAAYIGQYLSIAEATAAGAEDIKSQLFDNSKTGGYAADYSEGICFTVFIGEDGAENQEIYQRLIITEELPVFYSGSTSVNFFGLKDKDGQYVPCYVVDGSLDSYGDYNYLTILVDEGTDRTALAPIFSTAQGLNLYADDGLQVSGKSLQDFSGGPVQYSASAENGKDAKSYWLQVISADPGPGRIYINSLADPEAETSENGGTVYSTRELFIDGLHDDVHDILLINIGSAALAGLSVELASDVVELDEYWTLKGTNELEGFSAIETQEGSGELSNMAMVRLKAKEGAEGIDASGTLTFKSGGKTLLVLTLTGVIGDPAITTEEIPEAVKYVPYGIMIQNSNKYSWNRIRYSLEDGALPQGVELKPNGEIYGIPKEAGEFTFTVTMESSNNEFSESMMEYTLIVKENTDSNVDAASDQGYAVIQRIPDITLSSTEDYTFISEGEFAEFIDLYLDGEKLTKGVDYTAESGSTKMTVKSQTLKGSNRAGKHTLGAEFRTKEDNSLKRSAQNYEVTDSGNGSGISSGNGSSSGSGSSGGKGSGHSSGSTSAARSASYTDASWSYDASGWRCKNADGSWLANTWQKLPWNGTEGWYYFNAEGFMATGWLAINGQTYYLNPVSDGTQGKMCTGWRLIDGSWYYFNEAGEGTEGAMAAECWRELHWEQTKEWYYFDKEGRMATGWLDADGQKYYLNPNSEGTRGKMYTGWQQIDGNWYYFNETSDGTKGALTASTRVGNYDADSNGVRIR